MKLTKAQRTAVLCDNNALVVACPGSGKTRALIAKLLRCIEEVRNTPRKIGCITYTNAAVYEIEKRLQLYGSSGDGKYAVVSTIHSFCINDILSHFHWKIPEYKDGFSVLAPDTDEYKTIAREVIRDLGFGSGLFAKFEHLSRELNGEPNDKLPPEVAREFWNRLQQQAYLDFPNIIYYSYILVNNWPSIASGMASKYAWLLMDEFQDTSSLQVEILKKIADYKKTKFFLVGDPEQSIYGFAGAKPELMPNFAAHIKAETPAELLINFRSSKPIVRMAEALIPRTQAMQAEGPEANETIEPRWIHARNSFEAITDHLIPAIDKLGIPRGETAILAPWWISLLPLGRSLREFGIPIVGPGARPYKRKHLFAMLAERLCDYAARPDPRTIPRIERELHNLVVNATGNADNKVHSYRGRIVLHIIVNNAKELREKLDSGVDWLLAAAKSTAEILIEHELLGKQTSQRLVESANDIIDDMKSNKIDLKNLAVDDLGLFSNYEDNLKLVNMHRVKGLEFKAVAVIDVHDGKVPYKDADTDPEVLKEGKRLFYVAITRAKKLLMIITDDEDFRNPSRFLGEDYLNLTAEEPEQPW